MLMLPVADAQAAGLLRRRTLERRSVVVSTFRVAERWRRERRFRQTPMWHVFDRLAMRRNKDFGRYSRRTLLTALIDSGATR